MLRLLVIVAFAAGVALGMKLERGLAADRCLDQGGAQDAQGVCVGAVP